MFDTTPTAVAEIVGDARKRRAYRRGATVRRRTRSTSLSTTESPGRPRPLVVPAPCTSDVPRDHHRGREGRGRRGGCLNVRSSWSVSSTSPTRPGRSATSTRSGPTPTCRTATPATRPRPSSTRSSGSPRASATASSRGTSRPDGLRGLQPQLRRRRHRRRSQLDRAARRAAPAPRPLLHGHSRHVPLLGLDSTRCGDPWHVLASPPCGLLDHAAPDRSTVTHHHVVAQPGPPHDADPSRDALTFR